VRSELLQLIFYVLLLCLCYNVYYYYTVIIILLARALARPCTYISIHIRERLRVHTITMGLKKKMHFSWDFFVCTYAGIPASRYSAGGEVLLASVPYLTPPGARTI
jgi:hypothetical protein